MKMKYTLTALLFVTLLVKPEFVNEPSWLLWGNPELISYDTETQTYTNRSTEIENWRRFGDSDTDTVKKLTQPEKVPTKKKLILSVRTQLFYHKYTYICVGTWHIMSHTSQNKSSWRFILINVEETLLDLTKESDRQYRVWPHLALLFVGTTAHEEGYDVILWDELVQGKVPLEKS